MRKLLLLFSLVLTILFAAILLLQGKRWPDNSVQLDGHLILQAQTKFSFDLIEALGRQTKATGNIVVSPASVASVFMLLSEGSNMEMRESILKTLAFDVMNDENIGQLFAQLRAARAELSSETGYVKIADSLFSAQWPDLILPS